MADMDKEVTSMGASRDENMSIEDILNDVAKNEKESKKEETTFAKAGEEKSLLPTNPKDNTTENRPADISREIEDDGLTPLERLRKQRAANAQGLKVAAGTAEGNNETKELKNFAENDERMDAIQERIDDFDNTFNKRNELVLIKELRPDTPDEMEATAEIESVTFDANGNAIIPEGLKFFRKRDKEHEDIFGNPIDENGERINKEEDVTPKEESSEEKDIIDELYAQIPEKNKKIAEILIDKTGLGGEVFFTDEEKEKIKESDEIHLREIQVIDINAIRAKASTKSFSETIGSMDTTGVRTPMAFPASGYSAQIKGLSFGEYTDVAIDIDTDNGNYGTFDQNYKRLSILYNKITNVSSGSFASFEDFLKQTSWTDIDLGLYGLLISTESENTSVQLICGKCKERFDHKYSPRSLIQFKLSGYKFMEKWKSVITSPPSDYEKLHEESMVSKSTSIVLPNSKYVVEVGLASAYEYLYNFIPLSDPDRFQAEFGEDENDSYRDLVPFLLSVKTIFVPDGNGNYITCESGKDILEALYSIPLDDMRIVSAYTNKYLDEISASFAFTNAECPHCHHKMRLIPIEMNELVFQAYRHSMSITIDSKSIQEI